MRKTLLPPFDFSLGTRILFGDYYRLFRMIVLTVLANVADWMTKFDLIGFARYQSIKLFSMVLNDFSDLEESSVERRSVKGNRKLIFNEAFSTNNIYKVSSQQHYGRINDSLAAFIVFVLFVVVSVVCIIANSSFDGFLCTKHCSSVWLLFYQ